MYSNAIRSSGSTSASLGDKPHGTGSAAAAAFSVPVARGNVSIELIEDRAALPLSGAEWNALVAGNETNTIFQTFEWFDAWWRTFGPGSSLFFLLARQGEQIIGFAALLLRRNVAGLKQLEFVGTGNADYQDFVLPIDKPQALAAMAAFLRAQAHRWDRIHLCNLPERSSTLEWLRTADLEGLRVVHEARSRCPALVIEDDTAAARRLIGKYSLRRPLNWFSRRGELRFRHVMAVGEVEALLPQFFDQHVRRWRAAGKPSLFEDNRQRNFYAGLATTLRSTGWLLFSVVELDGLPIAFHFGFDYGGTIIWYKPSFDVRYAEHSPGLLLTRQLIEDTLHRSRREIDFTIGEEPFKDRFANCERFNATISLYHSRKAAWLARALMQLMRQLGQLRRRLLRQVQPGSAPGAKEHAP